MAVRTIKVIRNVIPDNPWIVRDFSGEIDEQVWPTEEMMEWVGGRPQAYFKAVRSPDGWQIKRRLRGLYW